MAHKPCGSPVAMPQTTFRPDGSIDYRPVIRELYSALDRIEKALDDLTSAVETISSTVEQAFADLIRALP